MAWMRLCFSALSGRASALWRADLISTVSTVWASGLWLHAATLASSTPHRAGVSLSPMSWHDGNRWSSRNDNTLHSYSRTTVNKIPLNDSAISSMKEVFLLRIIVKTQNQELCSKVQNNELVSFSTLILVSGKKPGHPSGKKTAAIILRKRSLLGTMVWRQCR